MDLDNDELMATKNMQSSVESAEMNEEKILDNINFCLEGEYITREHYEAIQGLLDLYCSKTEQLNTALNSLKEEKEKNKELEHQQQVEIEGRKILVNLNENLKEELNKEKEKNKELEATLKQTQDSWYEDTKIIEEYKKELNLNNECEIALNNRIVMNEEEDKWKKKIKGKIKELDKAYEDSKDNDGVSPYYYPDYIIDILKELLEG